MPLGALSQTAACKGVAVVNSTTGEPVEFLGPNSEADSFSLRWNDGKCDPQGRLWVGSMDMQFGEPWVTQEDGKPTPNAALYCYEGSGDALKITKKLDGVCISNGLVWNKAGDTFYYIDTPTMQVDAFDFDGATGEVTWEKPLRRGTRSSLHSTTSTAGAYVFFASVGAAEPILPSFGTALLLA